MKIVIIALLTLTACGPTEQEKRVREVFGIKIEKIRDCEYVVYKSPNGYSSTMIHAEDCTNPIHTKSKSKK